MKKVLIVAYYFPPIATIGALRPLGFCRYLEQHGWLPRVLTTDPSSVYPPQGVDVGLCDRLPKNLAVDRVRHTDPLQALIRARDGLLGLLQNHFRNGNQGRPPDYRPTEQGNLTPPGKWLAAKDLVLNWAFAFPDPQCSWLRSAVHRLSRPPREEYPDVVFATGGPWTSLLVGKTLAAHFEVPFVADFRDPWTGNKCYSFSSPYLENKAKQLERSICKSAARVICNTEELRTKFCAEYPEVEDKCITITNGFDRENCLQALDSYPGHDYLSPHLSDGQVLELCHFGNVYSTRNPLPLFRAIMELFEEKQITHKQLRVRFVGAWERKDDHCERLAQELEKQGLLRREAPVTHQVCLQQMARAKVLFILEALSPIQIPAKLYEYIATGRPLLVIGGEGATAQLINQYRLGLCCPNLVPDIKKLLSQLATGKLQLDPPDPSNLSRFEYRSLTGELAKVFDDVCLERARRS